MESEKTYLESQHATGPWGFNLGSCPHYQGQVYQESGKTLAITYNDETGSNTRLIAAAPDLLAACSELVTILEEEGGRIFKSNSPSIRLARAAIAKAKDGA